MKKPIIQLCFSLKTGLTMETLKTKMETVKTKLDEMYGEHCYEVRSCHLSKSLCLEKGFSTEVPDLFSEIFGNDYICELANESKFEEAMKKINDYRSELSKKATNLIILAGENVTNVALELELFTKNRVMIF